MKEEIKTAEIVMYLVDIKTERDGKNIEVFELTYSNHDNVLFTRLRGTDKSQIAQEIVVEVQCL